MIDSRNKTGRDDAVDDVDGDGDGVNTEAGVCWLSGGYNRMLIISAAVLVSFGNDHVNSLPKQVSTSDAHQTASACSLIDIK
jgi:hypothetical protein